MFEVYIVLLCCSCTPLPHSLPLPTPYPSFPSSPHMPLPLIPPPPLPSQYYMFYNVGAGSTVATIAEKIVQSKERGVGESASTHHQGTHRHTQRHTHRHTERHTHRHTERHTHRHTETCCALTLWMCVSFQPISPDCDIPLGTFPGELPLQLELAHTHTHTHTHKTPSFTDLFVP